MLEGKRFIYILEKLEREKVINLRDICDELNASESTIRRDFARLESQHKLKRIHGGAMNVTINGILTIDEEVSMDEKIKVNQDEKMLICKYAAHLIPNGACIFVDSGTTFMYLVDYIERENKRVKIVTNNDLVRTKTGSDIHIITLGGNYYPKAMSSCGLPATEVLMKYNFDYAFIGCNGINERNHEVYSTSLLFSEVKQVAMENAAHCVLMYDYSKSMVKGIYRFKKFEDFDVILTNKFSTGIKQPGNLCICKACKSSNY